MVHSQISYCINIYSFANITTLKKLVLNPILHMWIMDSSFTCDGSPTLQVFPLIFYMGMVI